MKRCISLALVFLIVLCFSSCGLVREMPDSVTINGKEYKKAFTGELYPNGELFLYSDGVKISGNSYYKYSKTQYDCYITYDSNAEPNVFFSNEQFEEAVSHYNDSDNFYFYCLFGNVADESEQQIIEIHEIDSAMFSQLIDFAKNNDYNPFTSFNNEEGIKEMPVPNPNDWMADEIHLYKESKDEAFSTSQGYVFKIYENQLWLLYYYYDDSENNDTSMMKLRAIPAEISDYFCTLIENLQPSNN